jgi:hypothetical protein
LLHKDETLFHLLNIEKEIVLEYNVVAIGGVKDFAENNNQIVVEQ